MGWKRQNAIKINFSKFIKAHNGSRQYVDMDKKMVELFDHPSVESINSTEYYTLFMLENPKSRHLFSIHYDEDKIWLELPSRYKYNSISEQELRDAFDKFKEFFIKLSFAGYTDIKIRRQKKEDNNND